jgi:predicted nuclease with TOPRIM domain
MGIIWDFYMTSKRLSSRVDALEKLAGTVSRKDIEAELKQIRNSFGKARQNYERANQELSQKQQEVDNYQAEMNQARQRLVELNNHVNTMDLTGAESVYSAKDDSFYVIDGKKFHVDKSDINDVKLIPYKEFRSSLKEEGDGTDNHYADTEFASDISFAEDEIIMPLIHSLASRYE